MSTIDDSNFVKKLIESEGYYEDDSQIYSIWSYINMAGRSTQKIYYSHQTLEESPFVLYPVLLWTRDGITECGKDWLRMQNEAHAVATRSVFANPKLNQKYPGIGDEFPKHLKDAEMVGIPSPVDAKYEEDEEEEFEIPFEDNYPSIINDEEE